MRTLALVVEYDGTAFHGFQRQTRERSVAGELERALSRLFGHEVRVVGAGRTDAGVHATGQVVSLQTASPLPAGRIAVAASALLRSAGIAVLRAAEREPGFSAWRHALRRTYRYRILNRPSPSPLLEKRAFWVRARLDGEAMSEAASRLLGERDFLAFCATPPAKGPTVRTVSELKLERHEERFELLIAADSFLHQMVRIIVGTLVEVGRKRRRPGDIEGILASRDRKQAGFTAPPHGLYLERVEYADPI